MTNKDIVKMLNTQIGEEFQSAYQYLAMSSYCRSVSMDGFAKWLEEQAKEEQEHALKIYNYLHELGENVSLAQLTAPKGSYSSVLEVFEHALQTEKDITTKLDTIANAALECKDNTSYTFLQWFLTEQVEEVASMSDIVEKLRIVGDSGTGLLSLDRHYGKRVGA